MHVPDHFLNDPTSLATALAAVAGVATALVSARKEAGGGLSRVTPPTVAGTAALVFALQMLNYPVASGTSGHLLGGALGAALLGPAWGVISVTAVLLVQGLVFADGGLTALGTNTVLMALVGTLVGWWVMRAVSSWVPGRAEHPAWRSVAGLSLAAAAGGGVSVVAASAVFTVLFMAGGTVSVPAGALAGQMLAIHALIGVGEALITGALVGVVAAVAPGWCALDPRRADASAPVLASARRRGTVVVGAMSLVAAGILSPLASSAPDGLEATAGSVGFAGAARDHALGGFPLADYGAVGGLSVQVVALIGVVLCAVGTLAVSRALVIGRLGQPALA
jgi:cobalt/nickel transport system permease protein